MCLHVRDVALSVARSILGIAGARQLQASAMAGEAKRTPLVHQNCPIVSLAISLCRVL